MMKVFISWSGNFSGEVSGVLKEWLPLVLQSVRPFVSSEDLRKGTRWLLDVSRELEATNFGILCLTDENKNAPWILFEAGALSKMLELSRVSPFLIGLNKSDLSGPLSNFQATEFDKDDVRRLIHSINEASSEGILDTSHLDRIFDRMWPDFDEQIKAILQRQNLSPLTRSESQGGLDRLDRLIIRVESLLETSREQAQFLSEPSSILPKEYILEIIKLINDEQIIRSSFDRRHPAIKVTSGYLTQINNICDDGAMSNEEKFQKIKTLANEIRKMLEYVSNPVKPA